MSGIVGTRKLVKKLNALEAAARGKVMLNAVVAGGLEIVGEAKRKAPWKTGTLRRSIHIGGHTNESSPDFTPSDKAGTYSDIGGEKVSGTEVSVLIGTNLIYAAPQEYGSLDGTLPAHPYMRPAIDTKTESCFKVIGEALRIMINKVVR